jgi:heat shock protein HtpX
MMAGFLVFVIAVGYIAAWYYESSAILYIAVAVAFVMNFWAYWNSDKQVLRMTNAKPATKEEYFDFYTVAENLSITAGMQTPKLYVIADPAPNAFSTGRDEKHAVVCATTGLLSMMNRSELEGVIAHELSHIRNRDILLMTTAVVLAGFVAILADIFLRMSSIGGGRRDDRGNAGAIMMVLAIVGIVLAPLAATLIELAVSRRREYLADASGALLTRYPEGLAAALQKIGNYAGGMQRPSHATAHLFIGDPFGPKPTDWIDKMFSTHPPIPDRVRALVGQKS